MINQKERLAEFIIKNLIFVCLYGLFALYAISSFIIPKANAFQEARLEHRNYLFTQNQIEQQNKDLQQQMKNLQIQNNALLALLQTPPNAEKLQMIAQDFLKSVSVQEKSRQRQEIFLEATFEIKGVATSIPVVFDLIKQIRQALPNAKVTLPFIANKDDPLQTTLDVTIAVQITQILAKNLT